MQNKIKGLLVEEQGQGMTEYGLVLGVIAVGVVAVLLGLRTNILSIFNKINNNVSNATTTIGN